MSVKFETTNSADETIKAVLGKTLNRPTFSRQFESRESDFKKVLDEIRRAFNYFVLSLFFLKQHIGKFPQKNKKGQFSEYCTSFLWFI